MKTRLDYIKELRKRFVWVLIPSLLLLIVAFSQTPALINSLLNYYEINAVSLSPAESVSTSMNFAFAITMLFMIPALLYQMFAFSKEIIPQKAYKGILTKSVLGIVFASVGFVIGITFFGKLILNGMMMYNIGTPMWSVASVLKLTALFGLAIAGSIQMLWFIPLVVKADLTTKEKLKKARPFLLIGILIVSALITPPDLMSMSLMALPLYGSFEGGLLFSQSKSKQEVSIC